jgi:hypothetical protein
VEDARRKAVDRQRPALARDETEDTREREERSGGKRVG